MAVGARPVEAALKGARMSGWSTHALGDSGGALAARGRVGGPGPPNAPPRRSLVMVVFPGHEIGCHFSLKICCRSEVKTKEKHSLCLEVRLETIESIILSSNKK